MRNLLLILLLANILYFLWGWVGQEEDESGVAILDETELGPPLPVAERPPENEVASVGATLDESPEESTLTAVVGRSCVTIGPFRNSDDADTAQTRYAGEGMRTHTRSGQGEFFVGHWVQIRNIPSKDEANRMLEVLHANGLPDAYTVETEDEGLKISLGLFGNQDSAERIELQARSLEFNADITPRMGEGTVYWVDIGLPPGRGAGEIIERYGEEKVRLREASTCPDLG